MPTAEQRFVSFPNKYGPYDRGSCTYDTDIENLDKLTR